MYEAVLSLWGVNGEERVVAFITAQPQRARKQKEKRATEG